MKYKYPRTHFSPNGDKYTVEATPDKTTSNYPRQFRVFRNSEYVGLVETWADVRNFIEQDTIERATS